MYRLLFLLVSLVFISSCEKWNLKQPTHLNLNWRFHSTSNSQNSVTLDKGYVYCNGFELSGTRLKGDAVLINQSTPSSKIQFSAAPLNVTMDTPMGEYSIITLAALVDNSFSPCMRLEGQYVNGSTINPVVIEWKSSERLNFKTKSTYSFQKKQDYNVYIGIDVEALLSSISANFWSSASITIDNGKPTIFINEYTNTNLFNKINQSLDSALILQAD